MKNISIKTRLVVTMAVMGAMLLIGGLMGVLGVQTTNNYLKEVRNNQLPSTIAINNAQINLLRARTALDRVVMHPELPNAADTLKRAENFHAESEKAWQEYLAMPQSSEEKVLSDDLAAKRKTYLDEGAQALIAALRADRREEADQIMMKKIVPLFVPMNKSAETLAAYQLNNTDTMYAKSQSMFKQFWVTAIAGIVLGVGLVIVSGFLLIRAITKPLAEVHNHLDAIASGDLTTNIKIDSNNEMGILGNLKSEADLGVKQIRSVS
ncbi:MAG: Tar ligand binding domain-containing protein [Burkholderiaceae bacterium]